MYGAAQREPRTESYPSVACLIYCNLVPAHDRGRHGLGGPLERLVAASRAAQEAYESDDVNLHGGWVGKEPGDKGPHAIRGVMMPGWRAPEFAEYMGSDMVLDYVRLECRQGGSHDARCRLHLVRWT